MATVIPYDNYDELKTKYEFLNPGEEHRDVSIKICGQIVSKRTMGKKIIFFEVKNLDMEQFIQILIESDDIDVTVHDPKSPSTQQDPNVPSPSPSNYLQIEPSNSLLSCKGSELDPRGLRVWLKQGDIIVVTGFIARSKRGSPVIQNPTLIQVMFKWEWNSTGFFIPQRRATALLASRKRTECSPNTNDNTNTTNTFNDNNEPSDNNNSESDNNKEGATTQLPLCLNIKRHNQCQDSRCRFRHEMTPYEQDLATKRRKKAEQVRSAEHDDNDPYHNAKESKSHRAKIFAAWLVQTFGTEFLCNGTGVLDVAGGRGELSFHLVHSYQVPSTLIEPRNMSPLFKKNEPNLKHIQGLFDENMLKDPNYNSVLTNCSIIIGMHPDQATEKIVDMALSLGKPFAVVPCCVFPSLFPHRRLANSDTPVVLYHQFLEYLRQKNPEIIQTYLHFKGRNKVLVFGADKLKNNFTEDHSTDEDDNISHQEEEHEEEEPQNDNQQEE